MSKNYSEDQLIEQPCMDIFQELTWETANVLADQIKTNLNELGL